MCVVFVFSLHVVCFLVRGGGFSLGERGLVLKQPSESTPVLKSVIKRPKEPSQPSPEGNSSSFVSWVMIVGIQNPVTITSCWKKFNILCALFLFNDKVSI